MQSTIDGCRQSTRRLYHVLPERNRIIRPGTLRHWRGQMLEGGYSSTDVNHFIVVANGYLGCVHAWELQLTGTLEVSRKPQTELTRNEYLRLLSTTKVLGREQVYPIVKVFGNPALPVHELERLTVEAAQTGLPGTEYN